jgi:acid phosphatase family membrane protein YuiD
MSGLLHNHVLIAALIAWQLAQLLKIPFHFWRAQKIEWRLYFRPGGMPSSHSALMISTSLGIALFHGFDNPLFALSVAISMIVLYDAAGVRRQAGMHAQKINLIIEELLQGHPISQEQLKEVLGHSPLEVVGGTILGIVVPLVYWLLVR